MAPRFCLHLSGSFGRQSPPPTCDLPPCLPCSQTHLAQKRWRCMVRLWKSLVLRGLIGAPNTWAPWWRPKQKHYDFAMFCRLYKSQFLGVFQRSSGPKTPVKLKRCDFSPQKIECWNNARAEHFHPLSIFPTFSPRKPAVSPRYRSLCWSPLIRHGNDHGDQVTVDVSR